MIMLKDEIEQQYDKVGPDELIFNDPSWNKKYQWGRIAGIVVALPAFILFAKDDYGVWVFGYVFIWGLLSFFSFYKFSNQHAKKQMEKLLDNEVVPTKGFFKFWANASYHRYKFKKFYELLLSSGILTNTSADILITDKCKTLFENESKHEFKKENYFYAGTFLLFIVPVWVQFIDKLFSTAKNLQQLGLVLLNSAALLLVIYMIIFMVGSLNRMSNDYLNKRSNKYKDIARYLELLNINLEMKYPNASKSNGTTVHSDTRTLALK